MKRILLIALLVVLVPLFGFSQKKKDLLTKIESLEGTINALNDSVSVAKRAVNVSNSKAELAEKENTELREANATLLQNLTNFSKISKKNTETVNSALTSLNQKEQQLRVVSDNFAKNDSTAIVLLTQGKQVLGSDISIGVSGADIIITNSLTNLFESDQSPTLSEAGKIILGKIAQLLKRNPDRALAIEALNITGDFDVSYLQAVAVANELWKVQEIPAERLNLTSKDGNFKEGIVIRLSPNYKAFYTMTKENM